jgi:F-type H+-transporting ATPase subunit gamma
MASGLRDIKRRIKSVQSTKKITRAMELIAASRVVKAQQAMMRAHPYAEAITAALSELYSNGGSDLKHSYLELRTPVKNAAVIVITSDRGMAGAYSSSILRHSEELYARLRREGTEPKVFVTGRKGAAYYRFRSRPVFKAWTGFSERPQYDNVKEIADAALDAYKDGEVDEIYVVYTRFITSFTQKPEVRRFLPLEVEEVEPTNHGPRPQYEYEPDAPTVLNSLLPRYIEARLFSAFLESAASENAARRRAMSTATDNATELIGAYTRQYNQARQAAITQELMEVVAAAEAFGSADR